MQHELPNVVLANQETNKLLIGRAFVELNDFSEQKFSTTDLNDFCKYVKASIGPNEKVPRPVIEYDETGLRAFRNLFSVDPRNDNAFAYCRLSTAPRLERLIQKNGNWMPRGDLETLLQGLKENLSTAGLELLDNIKNFSLSKITKVKRQKQKNGDYSWSVTRESAGTDDFVPPDALIFEVPIFSMIGVSKEQIKFDFNFDYTECSDGNIELKFKIENLNLADNLFEIRRKIIKEEVDKIDIDSFWGSRGILIQTDEWKYKSLESF